jgi:UDP-glucose 4-epimerase
MHEIDLRKRPAEAVVRSRRPDALVHMATVAHLQGRQTARNRMSLGATKAAIDYCDRYQVGQAIFVGRHTYYGASPDSPLYHNEDEPPVNSDDFPELADLVAADLFAGSALWRHPQINTAVLRLCYTLGPSHHGTLAGYLSGRKVPTVMGFDPLFQFIHEADAVGAIIAALQAKLRGVFNVAGPSPLPLSKIIEEAGREQVPIPETLFRFVAGRFGFPPLPVGAINHIKFPVVVDTTTFRQATGFVHRYDEYETLAAFREPELVTKSEATI